MPRQPLPPRLWSRLCRILLLALWGQLLLACAAPPDDRPLAERLPAEFAGELPCADCPAIRERLQLRPDHVFVRRQVRLDASDGQGGAIDDAVGRWVLSADGRTLLLVSVEGERWRYGVESAALLRPLDVSGSRTDQLALKRVAQLTRIEPQVTLWGYYRSGAEGPLFSACELERDLVIAGGRASDNLHRSGAEQPAALMAVEGRLLVLLANTEQPRRDGLVVNRLLQVQPDASCDQPVANQPLLATRWELVELEGQMVAAASDQPQPFIQLLADGRLVGFTGCNQMMGQYALEGASVAISQLVATRRACRGGAVLELMFSDALTGAKRWHLLGDLLELRDAKERRLARFRAAID